MSKRNLMHMAVMEKNEYMSGNITFSHVRVFHFPRDPSTLSGTRKFAFFRSAQYNAHHPKVVQHTSFGRSTDRRPGLSGSR